MHLNNNKEILKVMFYCVFERVTFMLCFLTCACVASDNQLTSQLHQLTSEQRVFVVKNVSRNWHETSLTFRRFKCNVNNYNQNTFENIYYLVSSNTVFHSNRIRSFCFFVKFCFFVYCKKMCHSPTTKPFLL